MFIVFFLELVTMKNNEQAIREAAYYIWQNAGCPSGQDEYFWSMAVEQLSKKNNCKVSCAKKSSSSAKKTTSAAKKSTSKKSK